jgi:hypothetical protein
VGFDDAACSPFFFGSYPQGQYSIVNVLGVILVLNAAGTTTRPSDKVNRYSTAHEIAAVQQNGETGFVMSYRILQSVRCC